MDGVVPNEPVIGSKKRAMFPQCNIQTVLVFVEYMLRPTQAAGARRKFLALGSSRLCNRVNQIDQHYQCTTQTSMRSSAA
jgi:hypothetical protein